MAERYYVVPGKSGWDVRKDKVRVTTTATKAEAERLGRDLAGDGGEIVIYGKDGRIRETNVFPKGFGTMKGKFEIKRGVDITKPIFEQAEPRRNVRPPKNVGQKR